jgi:hypothetical protein
MGVLERKKDGTEVISVRIPTAIKAKLVELRRRAHILGFNFNATLVRILSAGANQIHEELDNEEQKIRGAAGMKRWSDAGGKAAANGMGKLN